MKKIILLVLLTVTTVSMTMAFRNLNQYESTYQKLSNSQKLDFLWKQIESSEYSGILPSSGANGWETIAAIFPKFLHD